MMRVALRQQFWYSVVGLCVGLVLSLSGIALFFRGISGASSWTASFLGLQSKLSDAPPGVVLFIVGFFVIFVTRYVVMSGDDTIGDRRGSRRKVRDRR